jgi:hypothetical protein
VSQQLVYSRGVGQYRASEVHNAVLDRMYKPNGTRRGVIFCHGVGQTADSNIHGAGTNADKILALAAAGYPVLCCDLSASAYAGANWGNNDMIAAIGAAWTYLKSPFGAKTDTVGLYGSSMGACGLAWVRANLSSVFAAGFSIPVLDVNDIYQNDKGGLRAGIGTAYGVTFPASLGDLSTHSPVNFGPSDLASLPLGLWPSSDDPVASNTASCQAWDGRGATVTVTDLGAVGHTSATVDPQQVVAFFDTHGGRA